MATDAFGRLRISQTFTTFENYVTPNGQDEDTWITLIVGTAAITYSADGYASLSCSANGDSLTRLTKVPQVYQPGKSRLIYMSSIPILGGLAGGYTGRIGLLNITDPRSASSSNIVPIEGTWFESDGNTLSFVEKNSAGTTTVNQSSWNIDTFDGNGPSGLTLTTANLNKNLLIIMDQEWLGVGRVRVGFNLNGINYYAHQFNHDLTIPYTSTPRLRLCYQIIQSSETAVAMRQICCTNISEGGYTPLGKRISISTPITGIPIGAVSGRKYIVFGIRVIGHNTSSFTNLGAILKIVYLNAIFPTGSSNKWARVGVQLHSTVGPIGSITGTLTYNTASVSGTDMEYAVGDGTQYITTDGYDLHSTHLVTTSNFQFVQSEFETLFTRTQCSWFDTIYITGVANNSGDIVVSADFVNSL